MKFVVASSNPGKLREYVDMARGTGFELDLIPNFIDLPAFQESAPTFAENAAGKALHYSRFTDEMVMADDSGLVVSALGGAPGVHSARYAGPDASDADRVLKLLREMNSMGGESRHAHFVCVVALAHRGDALAVVSDLARGTITNTPRGAGGFGYDPVFFDHNFGRTFAELTTDEKNHYSHRGKAFRKLLYVLSPSSAGTF
jgi:XTP/dITP diphosphohydrolase